KIKLIKNSGIEPDTLPNAVKRIIDNPDNEIIFYSFLKQQFPPISSKKMIYPKELNNLLQGSGIKSLFEFQVEAFEMIQKGKDIVIVAPTGTGKTESFLLPVISKIWESNPHPLLRRGVSAIIIYPTKALAKDQHKKISKYGSALGVNSEIFDGDTPKDVRNRIFQYPPDIIITNPDMLHYHMRSAQFRELLQSVKFVIIDEIHIAVGAFGSNLYFILKRLQRLSKYKIKFIGASATIGNGQEFASQLFGRDVKTITVETARKAAIHLLMVMPFAVSQYTITASIAQQLLYSKYKTLCFQNNHKNAEIINLMLKRARLKSAVHRAGLTKEYRDRVETSFRKGQLDILVSTPTLELGIDIGDVSAVISSIVDVTSFTQRLGRAGRKGQESIGALILRNDDPISTYYSTHPITYFEDVRKGYIEPKNEIVSYYQTLAAILDKPIEKGEFFEIESIIEQLVKQQLIRLTSKNLYRPIRRRDIEQLLKNYSIRGIGDTLTIKDAKQRILGERSMPMAARELHAGAIYLHGGKYYRSRSFNYKPELGLGDIVVEEMNPQNQKTTSMRFALPKIMKISEKKNVLGTEVVYCDLQITEYVTGYKITDIYSNELLGITEIDPPIVYTFPTKGFMFTAPHPSQI
ncbi:MAG: DEAD/DEAH box helicase, partial [Candidatus Heimdallarchaeota archaeon]|nr:DEAD/DEAH box helicase [Candidatus Heimdallarchaeota archaeon]